MSADVNKNYISCQEVKMGAYGIPDFDFKLGTDLDTSDVPTEIDEKTSTVGKIGIKNLGNSDFYGTVEVIIFDKRTADVELLEFNEQYGTSLDTSDVSQYLEIEIEGSEGGGVQKFVTDHSLFQHIDDIVFRAGDENVDQTETLTVIYILKSINSIAYDAYGRKAEEYFFKKVTTGAYDDL